MTFTNVLSLLGGLGMFLYGMKMMSEGLERVAGDRLRNLLEHLTRNRIVGMLVGALFTMIIQSSSATTVMVVGFVNAGLMNLLQAAPVIMGANIGTTITAQIIALDITKYAPLVLVIGVVLSMMKRKKSVQLSEVIVGFGILFIGLGMMSASLSGLGEIEGFKNIMTKFSNPLLGILAGMLFTAVVQSSSASIGILQAVAGEGLIGLGGATYVLMGQNIGTCITALLASINTNKTARRAAIIHLLFNALGAALFFMVINILPIVPTIEKLFPGNPMQQIATVHIAFNVLGVAVFLPLTKLLVRIATFIIPGEDPTREPQRLAYLDERLLTTPNVAVIQVVKEIDRMGRIAVDNLSLAVDGFTRHDDSILDEVLDHEKVINYLEHEITTYLVNLSQLDLPENDSVMVASF
ncbi:MAG: Na/Pi cotransporter family protein, partial [Clostridia bacterium]